MFDLSETAMLIDGFAYGGVVVIGMRMR